MIMRRGEPGNRTRNGYVEGSASPRAGHTVRPAGGAAARWRTAAAGLCALMLLAACQSPNEPDTAAAGPGEVPEEVEQQLATLPAYYDVIATGDVLKVQYYGAVTSPDATGEPYKIDIGDVLRVDVAGHPELVREEVLVLPDGTVSLPEIGEMTVTGKTIDQIAREAEAQFRASDIITPAVSVAVVQSRRQRGLLDAAAGEDDEGGTAAGSAAAGGAADDNAIEVPVFDNQSIDLPYIEPIDDVIGRPLEDVRAQIQRAYADAFGPETQVTVNFASRQEPPPQIFVTGNVVRPGPVPVTPGIDVLQAIAAAGGFSRLETSDNRITVVRARPDGSHEYIPAGYSDNRDQLEFAEAPIRLRRNDVVFVEKRMPIIQPVSR